MAPSAATTRPAGPCLPPITAADRAAERARAAMALAARLGRPERAASGERGARAGATGTTADGGARASAIVTEECPIVGDTPARPIIGLRHPAHLMLRPPAAVIDALVALASVPEARPPIAPSIEIILEVVAAAHGLRVLDLRSERRRRVLSSARQEAMWLARELTLLSTSSIGRLIGRRDHTTILHGIAVVTARRAADPAEAARIDAMGAEACARVQALVAARARA